MGATPMYNSMYGVYVQYGLTRGAKLQIDRVDVAMLIILED